MSLLLREKNIGRDASAMGKDRVVGRRLARPSSLIPAVVSLCLGGMLVQPGAAFGQTGGTNCLRVAVNSTLQKAAVLGAGVGAGAGALSWNYNTVERIVTEEDLAQGTQIKKQEKVVATEISWGLFSRLKSCDSGKNERK